MSKTEKKILSALIIILILLPFAVVRSPMEIFSRVGLLWLNYTVFVWYWAYAQEPIWKAILACYGISSTGVVLIYFGIDLLQEINNLREKISAEISLTPKASSFTGHLLWSWIFLKAFWVSSVLVIIYWPKRAAGFLKKYLLNIAHKIGLAGLFKQKNHHGKLAKILEKGSVGIILLVFMVPIPIIGLAAIAAMKIKRIKYGLWYLLAVNIIEILFFVSLAYFGTGKPFLFF